MRMTRNRMAKRRVVKTYVQRTEEEANDILVTITKGERVAKFRIDKEVAEWMGKAEMDRTVAALKKQLMSS
jgi:hypothetical protein